MELTALVARAVCIVEIEPGAVAFDLIKVLLALMTHPMARSQMQDFDPMIALIGLMYKKHRIPGSL